jgi:hypothetical protein
VRMTGVSPGNGFFEKNGLTYIELCPMNNTMSLKPGMNAKIVTEVDSIRELIHVRNSVIYDVNDQTITLAQTDPPVPESMINRKVIITYLVRDKEGPVRYGLPASITDLVDDYRLMSTQIVKALVVRRKSDPVPYSVRMFFRVGPTSKSRLEMSIYEKKVNILDISLGGARFSHRRNLRLEEGEVIEVYLDIDGKPYNLHAMVLRTWESDNERLRNELALASVEFVGMPTRLEHILSRKIREIERESRFGEGTL